MASLMRLQGTTRSQFQITPASFTGPPTTGLHEAGELHMDADEQVWKCTGSGTPGTWLRLVPESAAVSEAENPNRKFLGSIMDYLDGGTMTSNEVVFIRIYLFEGQTFEGIEWFPTTSGQGGKTLRFGLYRQNDPAEDDILNANGQPTVRLVQTTAFTANTATVDVRNLQLWDSGNYTIPPRSGGVLGTGYYWMAWWTNGGGGSGIKPLLSDGYRTGWLPVLELGGHGPVSPFDLPDPVVGTLTAGGGVPYFALKDIS